MYRYVQCTCAQVTKCETENNLSISHLYVN